MTAVAPFTAARGSSVRVTEPPVRSAIAVASATIWGSGRWGAGEAMRTSIPAVTPPSRYECAMLLAPSPR